LVRDSVIVIADVCGGSVHLKSQPIIFACGHGGDRDAKLFQPFASKDTPLSQSKLLAVLLAESA